MVNAFCTIYYPRERSLAIKNMIYEINLQHWPAFRHHEMICFKLCMVLDMTKLFSFIPVWVTLAFTQAWRVTGKIQLVLSFWCKVAWSNTNFCDAWLCKSDDGKEAMHVWRIWTIWAFDFLVCFVSFCIVLCIFIPVTSWRGEGSWRGWGVNKLSLKWFLSVNCCPYSVYFLLLIF